MRRFFDSILLALVAYSIAVPLYRSVWPDQDVQAKEPHPIAEQVNEPLEIERPPAITGPIVWASQIGEAARVADIPTAPDDALRQPLLLPIVLTPMQITPEAAKHDAATRAR